MTLPEGWRWMGDAPPAEFSLDREIDGSWLLAAG